MLILFLVQSLFFAPRIFQTSGPVVVAASPFRPGGLQLCFFHDFQEAPPFISAQGPGLKNFNQVTCPGNVFLIMKLVFFGAADGLPVKRMPGHLFHGHHTGLVHFVADHPADAHLPFGATHDLLPSFHASLPLGPFPDHCFHPGNTVPDITDAHHILQLAGRLLEAQVKEFFLQFFHFIGKFLVA